MRDFSSDKVRTNGSNLGRLFRYCDSKSAGLRPLEIWICPRKGLWGGGQQIVSDRTYAQSQVFLNPQPNPQKAMSCTNCVYSGNLHALVSR